MITPGAGVRVYLACGVTDMRKGMTGLTGPHPPFAAGNDAALRFSEFAVRAPRSNLILGRSALRTRTKPLSRQGACCDCLALI